MVKDTTREDTASGRNGDFLKYNSDTYGDEDAEPTPSASGHTICGITAIYPA